MWAWVERFSNSRNQLRIGSDSSIIQSQGWKTANNPITTSSNAPSSQNASVARSDQVLSNRQRSV